jgi:uncharacterized protein (DUF1499 family)
VVIRVTPVENRAVIDVRSRARAARDDMGTNARRVQAYIEAVMP